MRNLNKLNEVTIRNAKPKEKAYKLSDGQGMYLEIMPTGGKLWRLKYRVDGKEKRLALGAYPLVTLKEAREAALEARKKVFVGIDPSSEKKKEKVRAAIERANTFKSVALEWIENKRPTWKEITAEKTLTSLKQDIFPHLGDRPISEIEPIELLTVVKKIETRGAHETATRVLQRCRAVFAYGIITGRLKSNPAIDLSGGLKKVKVKHRAALPSSELPEFMKKLNDYAGDETTKLAIKLLALTFVRTGELRGAEWPEIDFDNATWVIPAGRMKMENEHLVPLSRQALEALQRLKALHAEKSRFVFPNSTTNSRCMSENTILYAIYRMGYHSRMTGHGFRAIARTVLDEELGFRPDWIEHQLAHAVRDPNGRAYNRTTHLEGRRKMMQAWANYLEGIAQSGKVIQIRKRKIT